MLVAALSACLAALAPLGIGVVLWTVVAICVAPGVLLAHRVYRGHPGAGLTALLVGPAWGLGLSTLALLALWTAGLRHWALVLLAPAIALLGIHALAPRRGLLRPPALTDGDLRAALLLLLLVPLIVGRPYSRIGADVPDGRAYRAYFTADVVWAMAVVSEVAKGDIPPRNPFLRGEPLHYYWAPHLLTAIEHRHLDERVRLDRLVAINAAACGVVFVAFLYAFARQFVTSPAAAALGCTIALMFTSFEGLERLLVLLHLGVPLDDVTRVNIDAVTRWFYGGLPIDGLHRVVLYQPGHHGLASALGLSSLLVMAQAREITPRVTALAGILLGAALLTSTFLALMIAVMAAVYGAVRVVQGRAWPSLLPCMAAAAVPLGAALVAVLLLEYDDPAQRVIDFGLNSLAIARPLVNIPLSAGPMVLLVPAGLLLLTRRRRPLGILAAIIVITSVAFCVFVNVRDHGGVYVGWRSGQLVFMAGAALAAVVLERLLAARRRARLVGLSGVGVLILAAAPTIAIDLYNTQDVGNRAMGPGFHWTLVLTVDELQGLEWIRRHTPPEALVQVLPQARDPETWSYIPSFAGRRMSAGLPISMVPERPYRVASGCIARLYRAHSPEEAYDVAFRQFINYLVVGPAERRLYPGFEAMLDEAPHLFPLVFRNAALSVYEVMPVRAAAHLRR